MSPQNQQQKLEGWTKKALPSVANQQQEPQTRIKPPTREADPWFGEYGEFTP